MKDLKGRLEAAVAAGELLQASSDNIRRMTAGNASDVVKLSIQELVHAGAWDELNDRFFRNLAFGTGGLRGRSVGRIVAAAERGKPTDLGRPEFPCVGTNAMNYYNISRATQGLVEYLKENAQREGGTRRPKIVLAHDTRHFSREFAELAARVAAENGCDAALFGGPRSTPELSFAVRHSGAQAGAVITASHNPPHDNGFKVYFGDGAQVVEPHASGIIAKVNALASDNYTPRPESEQGKIETLVEDVDEAYLERLESLLIDREMVAKAGLKVAFTSIHGTGGIIIKPAFERLGIEYVVVPEQERMDGRFPTVKSPNPENAEALAMAVELAKKEQADLVIGTDPDCDRMGVAVRNREGGMDLLTGNQIGSLMAWYRIRAFYEKGILNPENAARAVIIKTVVTTDLQSAIAKKWGLQCVETLTGFKYIGEKLGKYEAALPPEIRANYRELPEAETRAARLRDSKFYVFGGEESYGYSGADFIRDKDGNGAAIMFAEVAAHAKAQGLTMPELLDAIYAEYGYYVERSDSLTFEGAEGAAKIGRLIDSYSAEAPQEIDGSAVREQRNFAVEDIRDSEGELLPKERMMMFQLEDGRRIAVRPSGTEPKIKYYMFVKREPPGEKFTAEELAEAKRTAKTSLGSLWTWLEQDARRRSA